MPKEIERKFLIDIEAFRKHAEIEKAVLMLQGYILSDDIGVARVRASIGDGGARWAHLTVKGVTNGMVRSEFEYSIPFDDAMDMLHEFCGGPESDQVISKTRYNVPVGDLTWEIDIFSGRHDGLAIAEVELNSEDQEVEIPFWVTEEVTGNPEYLNSNLASSKARFKQP